MVPEGIRVDGDQGLLAGNGHQADRPRDRAVEIDGHLSEAHSAGAEALDRYLVLALGAARDEDLVPVKGGHRLTLRADDAGVDDSAGAEARVAGAVGHQSLEKDAVGGVTEEAGDDDPPVRL